MKLLRCPKGYIGTRVEELDILIDKEPHEERGYTLVDNHIAAALLKRQGYDEIAQSAYPRNLDLLKAKVRKQLVHPGVLMGEPSTSVAVSPAPISPTVEPHAPEPKPSSERTHVDEPVRQSWWSRFTRLFSTRT